MSQIRVVASSGLEFAPAPGRVRADPLAGVAEVRESVRLVRLGASPRRFAHRHPHSAEVMYVLEGSGTAVSGDTRQAVNAGDFVYVPADVPHATVPDEGVDMVLLCFFAHPDLDENTVELDELAGR